MTVDDLKVIFGVMEDQELGPLFGVKKGAVSAWRRNGVPPSAELRAQQKIAEMKTSRTVKAGEVEPIPGYDAVNEEDGVVNYTPKEDQPTRSKRVVDALRRHYGLSVGEFAAKLGLGASTVSSWCSKDRDSLDADLVFRMCPGVSYEFLITGEGPMFLKDTSVYQNILQQGMAPNIVGVAGLTPYGTELSLAFERQFRDFPGEEKGKAATIVLDQIAELARNWGKNK